jgi:predicted alpha/beta hydrolase
MHRETTQLEIAPGIFSAIHRFRTKESTIPVLLIHGSMESSRIFYSKSGKGFAPFLARKGFDVFAVDIAGKGDSIPMASKKIAHSQADFIHSDMEKYFQHIRNIYPETDIRIGAHSWGGVLALAWYAFYGNLKNTGPMVFFGTKRRIGVFHPKRIFMVDLMWSGVGYFSGALMGYVPTGKLKLGIDDEPLQFFRETNQWVYSRKWIDTRSGKDIAVLLKKKKKPPILHFAGVNDTVLGNPLDVERLMNETQAENTEMVLLGKANGNLKDYGHNDMLTAKEAPEDHFETAAKWFARY